jgi:hypothetical protein
MIIVFFSIAMQRLFAIGKYETVYGDGWRKATEAEWRNPAFQAALVQAHREGGGWPLLEEPLQCNGLLFVAEGWVLIDGARVIEVGYDPNDTDQQLCGVYPAMNIDTKVAWTTTAPALGNKWDVEAWKPQSNPPCLFVQVQRRPSLAPHPRVFKTKTC